MQNGKHYSKIKFKKYLHKTEYICIIRNGKHYSKIKFKKYLYKIEYTLYGMVNIIVGST